jgi:hypothetical protein
MGNPQRQTIRAYSFASITLVDNSYKPYNSNTTGADQEEVKAFGLFCQPKKQPLWFISSRTIMQLQKTEDCYIEGEFLPQSSNSSRLGTDRVFGDSIVGRLILDSPARIIEGKVHDGCSC